MLFCCNRKSEAVKIAVFEAVLAKFYPKKLKFTGGAKVISSISSFEVTTYSKFLTNWRSRKRVRGIRTGFTFLLHLLASLFMVSAVFILALVLPLTYWLADKSWEKLKLPKWLK